LLVDRGWRRSGNTYYKPDLLNSCCPHYTIRLEAGRFRPGKQQRQLVNAWNRHVLGDEYSRRAARLGVRGREEKRERRGLWNTRKRAGEAEYERVIKTFEVPRKEDERKGRKSGVEVVNDAAGIEGKARESGEEVMKTRTETVVPAHRFEVTLEPDRLTDEKYKLYAQYQRIIHNDPPGKVTRSGFKSFLCSGFPQTTGKGKDGKDKKLGSYHMCYRLDGKLVAFGVLDLLPHAVSSVYLVYVSSSFVDRRKVFSGS